MRPAIGRSVESVHEIDTVWSGHPVGFALLTAGDRQFAAYYDADRHLTVAQRAPGDDEWDRTLLPERVGWDSHNSITMAVDAADHIHLSGNMHGDPLVYFRTADRLDATTFERVESLVGRDEDRVTYPTFIDGPDEGLVFMYRDGGSGNGRRLLDAYDPESEEWRRLLATPLLDGRGEMNAYPTGPTRGPDGDYHLCWVWRDTPDAETNHDLSYARSPDLVDWERSDGSTLDLPITIETGEIVDPVPAGGGMINSNIEIGFDSHGRPVLSYHKFDSDGHTQVYNARLESEAWTRRQASDWDYRWEFGGRGSLGKQIDVDSVRVVDGRLAQTFWHVVYGPGRWMLDPDTLRPIQEDLPWHGLPAESRRPEHDGDDWTVQWAPDAHGDATTAGAALRWETLRANRDRPRDQNPDPSTLELYTFE